MQRLKSKTYNSRITSRGKVPESIRKKEDKFPVGPVLLGIFLFLIVGSALFQMLHSYIQGPVIE